MTMAPEPDEEFMAMMENAFGEDDLEPPDEAIDITALNDLQLSDLFNQTRDKLLDMGEMMADSEMADPDASTPEGRELHSVRAACLVELSKRGMR